MPQNDLAVLEYRISAERLKPYRNAVGHDLPRALALYEWNAKIAASFWLLLGHLEVLVRNAMHERLTELSLQRADGRPWYVCLGAQFNQETRQDIAMARGRVTSHGHHETPGRVIAELPLGFWRYLLARRYERTLWRGCLYRAFPGEGRRAPVHQHLAGLHVLRNRIAHHEPIHNRPLEQLHEDVLLISGWICPATQVWIARQSTVRELLGGRPG